MFGLNLAGRSALAAFFQNLIHDAFNRGSGIDCETALRNALFRCVHAYKQRPLFRLSSKFVFCSSGDAPLQRVEIGLKDKNIVEQINEVVGIS